MNAKLLVAVVAATLFPLAAYAECSGGAGGGMDATGNQCNTPVEAVEAAPERPASAKPATKRETRKAATAKRRNAPRETVARARVKQD